MYALNIWQMTLNLNQVYFWSPTSLTQKKVDMIVDAIGLSRTEEQVEKIIKSGLSRIIGT